jgi:GTP-binding protein
MVIKTAEFAGSSADVGQMPATDIPEFAFIGRSNVGKSSLINMLTGNSKLAMTSSSPGKTILINRFLINRTWYLVDLPGYGYAKRSKSLQSKFKKMIYGYISHRENLYCLFLLIDGNIPPQAIDLEFIHWLGENGIPFCLVFTKADKSKKGSFGRQVGFFLDKLKETWEELPPCFKVSSARNIGREEMLNYIEEVLKPQNRD